jgi:hypothetical protein
MAGLQLSLKDATLMKVFVLCRVFERYDFSDTDILALKESIPVRGGMCCDDAGDAGFDQSGLFEIDEFGRSNQF